MFARTNTTNISVNAPAKQTKSKAKKDTITAQTISHCNHPKWGPTPHITLTSVPFYHRREDAKKKK
jgi:hypothetical protein